MPVAALSVPLRALPLAAFKRPTAQIYVLPPSKAVKILST
jgi:hypothetical protein